VLTRIQNSMSDTKHWLAGGLMALLLLVFVPAAALAQFEDPISDLECGVEPMCPFDCDEVTLWIEGVLPNPCWSEPVLTQWDREGDRFTVFISTVFDPTIVCIQVLMPFRVELPVGSLAEGEYNIRFVIAAEHSMATMPVIPIVKDDEFRVALPGDLNCNGATNMQDVIHLIDYVFRGHALAGDKSRIDVTCDQRINVLDVVQLISHVLWRRDVCDPCDQSDSLPDVRIADIPPETLMRDLFTLDSVRVHGDALEIKLYHSGGCLEHGFAVYMTPPAFMESFPVQANLYIEHDDPGDPCDAWIGRTLRFDLRPIANAYLQGYGSLDDIRLNVHAYDQQSSISVLYSPD